MKLPGPEHPISITRAGKRVRVSFAGRVIADSSRTLALKEAGYPVVFYIPRAERRHGCLAVDRSSQPLPVPVGNQIRIY